MITFSKYTGFKEFVEEFMRLRQQAILDKNKGLGNLYKLCLNSSYGHKIINEEKFTKVVLCNTHQTLNNHLKPNFFNTIKFNNDVYQCELARKICGCNTPIQCGFFTLDNTTYWVLNIYYNFIEKCLDHPRFHYVEGDIDSFYFAIRSDMNHDINQGFTHIITDEKFYNENVYKWLPSDYYSSDNYNPTFETAIEKMGFDKKLLGYAIENQSQHMIDLVPKMYTAFNDDSTVSLKLKGVVLNKLI
jgi:hypothetical protein